MIRGGSRIFGEGAKLIYLMNFGSMAHFGRGYHGIVAGGFTARKENHVWQYKTTPP